MFAIRAYIRLLRHKIVAEKAPPENIARGWALGVCIGSTIPFGLQLIISIPLAFRFKISKIGATLGTLITNPVSIIFIYPAQCWVGSRILGEPLTWEYLRNDIFARLVEINIFSRAGWRILADLGGRVVGGFFIGGILLALIVTPATYIAVKRFVVAHRMRVQRRKAARQ
ncbi:MAG: DUF2062 domain-containing protein [Kiritimatiellae bacterium]|nr:DUF2062 domain-containing protein [Kiritimatiellia bacterium]